MLFAFAKNKPKSTCLDASKVAGGKFWRVEDRRNREYCETVRKDNFTVQGFVGAYKKTSFDLSGQQVMCFRKRVSLVEICFCGNRVQLTTPPTPTSHFHRT